jgi:hypothetical protein
MSPNALILKDFLSMMFHDLFHASACAWQIGCVTPNVIHAVHRYG